MASLGSNDWKIHDQTRKVEELVHKPGNNVFFSIIIEPNLYFSKFAPRQITAEPHNGPIDVVGMTIAHVSESFKIEKLEIFYDPSEIFNQLATSNNMKTEYLSQEGGEEQANMIDLDATGKTVAEGNCPMRPEIRPDGRNAKN